MSQLKITYRQILDILSQNNLLVEYNIKNLDEEIEFISHDSRNIVQNTLFFCKASRFKEEYLTDAVKKGAVCYVSEEKYNKFPKKSLGQNFLTNPEIPKKIADLCRGAHCASAAGVLEIGPGLGILTRELCALFPEVIAVEIDRTFEPILQETLGDFDN